jgi:hypothetical protein
MGRAVVVYAALWGVLDLVVLLPGDSVSFSAGWGFVGSILIQGLLVWRLARGSALAWTFGLLMSLGAVASLFLMAASVDVALTLIAVVCLAQAGVLLTPPMLVLSRRQPPPASA